MARIAWMVDSEYIRALEDRLEHYGHTIERFRQIIPTLRAFDTTRYDAIMLNTVVAPGVINFDYEKGLYDNDPRIKEIMGEYRGKNKNPDYWKLAMYAIEVAHKPSSPNARTPIFVVGQHDESRDALFPNAQETCRTARAIDYYNVSREERYDALVRDIRRLTT